MPTLPRQLTARIGPFFLRGPVRMSPSAAPPIAQKNWLFTGQTQDGGGSPLASCAIQVFRAGDFSLAARGTSDGSGNFSIAVSGPGPYFYRAVDSGGTVAGTTLGTLLAS